MQAILGAIGVAAFFLGLQIVLYRVLGKLAIDASGLSNFDPSMVWGLSDALTAFPGFVVQLLNWLYLDQALMIITTALLFSAAVKFFTGGSNG